MLKRFLLSLTVILVFSTNVRADLIALWRFDEGTGTSTRDVIGGFNGTLINTPTWVTGQFNNALDFDTASTEYVAISDSAHIATPENFCACAWIWLEAFADNRAVFNHGDTEGVSSSGMAMKVDVNDKLFCEVIVGTEESVIVTSTASISEAGVWTHICCRKSGTTVTGWINGSQDGSATGSTSTMDYTGDSVTTRIGASQFTAAPDDMFNGKIDEVRFYGHAITDAEILMLATHPSGIPRGRPLP